MLEQIEDLGMMFATEKSKRKTRFGLFLCPTCNGKFKSDTSSVKTGNVKMCKSCSTSKKFKTHGETKTKLYSTWQNMKQRCDNKTRPDYVWYGGRGIKVCSEWEESYNNFKIWALSNGYNETLTIERINSDGNYEPSNCEWATWEQQKRTTRKICATNKSGFRGISWDARNKKWHAQIGVDKKKIHLGFFDDIIEAAKTYDKYVVENGLKHTINGDFKNEK